MTEPVSFLDGKILLYNGDCMEVMQQLIDEGVKFNSAITDPPYHLQSIQDRFGKPGSAPAAEGVYHRASKGFLGQAWDGGDIAFRRETWSLVKALLDPGAHLMAFSGCRDYDRMGAAIRLAGFEIRDLYAWIYGSGMPKSHDQGFGYGTRDKPAFEIICLGRRPLSEKTIAENIDRHGTGALNIDGCTIGSEEITVGHAPPGTFAGGEKGRGRKNREEYTRTGRWPANVIHDGSEEVIHEFRLSGDGEPERFFYTAKASASEKVGDHPTVKPLALMDWLIKKVSPFRRKHLILDPFAGTGTTGIAAIKRGASAILIEQNPTYCADIALRIQKMHGIEPGTLFHQGPLAPPADSV